jgi:hypothetical protein
MLSNSGQPVTVKVLPGGAAGLFYALPEPLALDSQQVAGLRSVFDSLTSPQWLAGRGAVAVNDLYVKLIVTGKRSSGVQIVNIQPVVNCHAALTGTLIDEPAQGGNPNTQLLYNMANPLTPPSYTVNADSEEPNYFQHYTVSLKKGEGFTFLIHAYIHAAEYCQFSFNMTVNDGGRTVDQEINNNGSPFAITGTCAATSKTPFSCYHDLYIGGAAAGEFDPSSQDQPEGPPWMKVDPATYSQ